MGLVSIYFSLSLSLYLSIYLSNSIGLLSNQAIGLMNRVFASGLWDRGSIPGKVILNTQKIVIDAALLNTQLYKVMTKGKVKQHREWGSALLLHLSIVAIEKGAFRSPSTEVANFTYLISIYLSGIMFSVYLASYLTNCR